jgi:hypothetical protein
MPVDSGEIDNAVLARLNADATLRALMPGGAYFDLAPANGTQYILASITQADDARSFGSRAYEAPLYLVKAVVLSTVPDALVKIRQAAARIDLLLDPQPGDPPVTLTVPGYGLMTSQRDIHLARVRHTERDDVDPNIRFFHRGAHYRVWMSTLP